MTAVFFAHCNFQQNYTLSSIKLVSSAKFIAKLCVLYKVPRYVVSRRPKTLHIADGLSRQVLKSRLGVRYSWYSLVAKNIAYLQERIYVSLEILKPKLSKAEKSSLEVAVFWTCLIFRMNRKR